MSTPVFLFAILALAVALPALLLLPFWFGRREVRAKLEASRGLAEALALELTLAAPVPCDEPFREGSWRLEGHVDDAPIELLVTQSSVLLRVPLAGHDTSSPWELARANDFGPGGLDNDPMDPYRRLDPIELGPDWWVRGHDAEAHVRALSAGARAYLREPPIGEAPRVVEGRLVVSAPEASAARVKDWARGVVRAITREAPAPNVMN